MKIEYQHATGKYTLVGLSDSPPYDWQGNKILIEGKSYKTEIVYDLPKCIAVLGSGEFVGKEIAFV